jgi:hypothetical protein
MTMEFTFDGRGATRRPPVPTRAGDRIGPALVVPVPLREIGQATDARNWRAAGRGLQRAETVFAAAVCIGLLALGTMTFGYAFGGLATAQAADAHSVAASK